MDDGPCKKEVELVEYNAKETRIEKKKAAVFAERGFISAAEKAMETWPVETEWYIARTLDKRFVGCHGKIGAIDELLQLWLIKENKKSCNPPTLAELNHARCLLFKADDWHIKNHEGILEHTGEATSKCPGTPKEQIDAIVKAAKATVNGEGHETMRSDEKSQNEHDDEDSFPIKYNSDLELGWRRADFTNYLSPEWVEPKPYVHTVKK